MSRSVRITSFVVAAFACATVAAFAAGPARPDCEYIKGPATPLSFAPDPATGLITFTAPFQFGDDMQATNVEVAILGFLDVAADGFPERALVTHTWRIPGSRRELDWTGQANLSRTSDPTMAHYTIRLDVTSATRPGTSGVLFADGSFNLLNGSGTAGDFFGKVCRAPAGGR